MRYQYLLFGAINVLAVVSVAAADPYPNRPIRMIVANAGGEGSIVVEKVRASKDKSFGYNAFSDEYEDLVAAGVIDPTKVTRTALQNAASIASLLLTTEALIVEKKEKDAPAPAAPGGGMGGMY